MKAHHLLSTREQKRLKKYSLSALEPFTDRQSTMTWEYRSASGQNVCFSATVERVLAVTQCLDCGFGIDEPDELFAMFSDRTRGQREFEKVRDFQLQTHRVCATLLEPYVNQKSKVQLTCERCNECARPMLDMSKASYQTCKLISREKGDVKRIRSLASVVALLKKMGFDVIDSKSYKGKQSFLRLRCKNGCEFNKRAAYIQDGDVFGCPVCTSSVGAQLAIKIIAYATQASCEYEVIPDWLSSKALGRGAPLILDAMLTTPLGTFAIEYQGRQHVERRYDLQSEKAFVEQVERDRIKAQACEVNGMTLLCIDDLRFKKLRLVKRIEYLGKLLSESAAVLPISVQEVSTRIEQLLSDDVAMYSLLKSVTAASGRVEKLEDDLRQSGRGHLIVEGFDPIHRQFSILCSIHQHRFMAFDSNIFSARTGVRGTDCFKCGKLRMAQSQKLSEESVISIAKDRGYVLVSPYSDYKNQKSVLVFQSISNPSKIRRTRLHRL